MKPRPVLLSICALLPLPAFGNSADEASKPVPPSAGRPSEPTHRDEASRSAAVAAGKDEVLLPTLRGVSVASTVKQALHGQSTHAAGLQLTGFPASEEALIRHWVEPNIGKPVSLNSLAQLSASLESAFRERGQPFVKVSFPPQEITAGVIAIRIAPARTGRILLAGKPSFGLKFATAALRARPGKPLAGDVLADDLEWINRNPLRRASVSYRDGTAADRLDLTLKIRAEKPWRAYAGIDNQLSDSLGDERLFLGLQHGDFFARDHRVTAQFTSSLDSKALRGISGIYEIPLPIRHLLSVSLGYTESETDTLGPIDQSGEFARFGLDYRIPLPRWRAVSHEWWTGLELRGNDYLFSDRSSRELRFFQWETGWEARHRDRSGMTRLESTLLFSPGHGILGSNDEDFIALGADGADSLIARFELERSQKLPQGFTLVGRCEAQWADSELLSSDQISAGGVTRVRGFDETVGYASHGAIAGLELQSQFFPSAKAGDFRGIAFLDGALLNREESGDAGQLAAVGIGVRWRNQGALSAKLDLGIPLEFPDEESGDPKLHFAVSASW